MPFIIERGLLADSAPVGELGIERGEFKGESWGEIPLSMFGSELLRFKFAGQLPCKGDDIELPHESSWSSTGLLAPSCRLSHLAIEVAWGREKLGNIFHR